MWPENIFSLTCHLALIQCFWVLYIHIRGYIQIYVYGIGKLQMWGDLKIPWPSLFILQIKTQSHRERGNLPEITAAQGWRWEWRPHGVAAPSTRDETLLLPDDKPELSENWEVFFLFAGVFRRIKGSLSLFKSYLKFFSLKYSWHTILY